MSYSKELCRSIEQYLKTKDYRYEFDARQGLFSMEFFVESVIESVQLVIRVKEGSFTSIVFFDETVEEENRPAMAELIARINYGLRFGGFDLDMDSGRLAFRLSVYCIDCPPTQKVVARSISAPVTLAEQFGNAICAVNSGDADAKTAYEYAMQ